MIADHNFQTFLRQISQKTPKNIIFSYLNVNSLRKEFDDVKNALINEVDIFFVLIQKLTRFFNLPSLQFRVFLNH